MRKAFAAALLALAAVVLHADVAGPARSVRLLSLTPEDAGFRAVWMEQNERVGPGGPNVYTARLRADGTPEPATLREAFPSGTPAELRRHTFLGVRGDVPMVAWAGYSGWNLEGVFVSALDDGVVRNPEGKRIASGPQTTEVLVGCARAHCAATTASGVVFFDHDGNVLTDAIALGRTTSLSVDDRGAIVTSDVPHDRGIRVVRVRRDGSIGFAKDIPTTHFSVDPITATDGQNILVAWSAARNSSLDAALLGPEGTIVAQQKLLTVDGPESSWNGLDLRWDGNSYVLGVIAGKSDFIYGTLLPVQLIRFDAALRREGEPLTVDHASNNHYSGTPLFLGLNGDRVGVVFHRFRGTGWDRSPRVSVVEKNAASQPYWLETPLLPRRRATR